MWKPPTACPTPSNMMSTPALLEAASPRGPRPGPQSPAVLLAKPACCSAAAASACLPLLRRTGQAGGRGKCHREKSRQVGAKGGMGKERNALGIVSRGPAAPFPLLLCKQPLPAHVCRAARKGVGGMQQLSVMGGGGGTDKSLDFAHSVAETPAFPLPRTSGEQAMSRREGWREVHGHRCRGWLTRGACAGGARGCGRYIQGFALLAERWERPLFSHIKEWPVSRCSSSPFDRSCHGFIVSDFAFCEEERGGQKKKKKRKKNHQLKTWRVDSLLS